MKNLIGAFIIPVICGQLHAQVDTINTQTNRLLMSNLKEGTAKYAVFTTDSATGAIGYSDIWVRSVAFGSFHNTPAITFSWQWYRHDSLYKSVTDVCSRANFSPLYAYTTSTRQGIKAYNFDNGYMAPADTVAGNKADKKVLLNVPVFNWQWDMELFTLLPFKKVGQRFAIAFLDPNDDKPAYYMHTVTGEEELVLNGEAKVKCWKLRVEYNKTAYADFWISKQSHEVLKMSNYYSGKYRFKVKLY